MPNPCKVLSQHSFAPNSTCARGCYVPARSDTCLIRVDSDRFCSMCFIQILSVLYAAALLPSVTWQLCVLQQSIDKSVCTDSSMSRFYEKPAEKSRDEQLGDALTHIESCRRRTVTSRPDSNVCQSFKPQWQATRTDMTSPATCGPSSPTGASVPPTGASVPPTDAVVPAADDTSQTRVTLEPGIVSTLPRQMAEMSRQTFEHG